MRQLTYLKKNTLQWRDVPAPSLMRSSDAIIRPLAAARCDGDKVFLFNDLTTAIKLGTAVHYLDPMTTKLLGEHPYRGPFAVGHECVGEVFACGDDVRSFCRGDKVIVPWAVSCGTCAHCHLGLTSRCISAGETPLSAYGFGPGMGTWGGMVSDLIRVPFADQMLVAVPQGIDPVSIASASDNIPDAWRTVAPYLSTRPNSPVLVVGGGAESIGLYAAAIAVALDSSRVEYIDFDLARLDLAERLGAKPIQIPRGSRSAWYRRHAPRIHGDFPIAVDASANADGLRYALRSLAAGGTCTSVGYYFQKATGIPLLQMFANDSTLHTGISHPRATLPQILRLIAGGRFQPEKITSLLATWEDADHAYLARTTKVVVHRPAMIELAAPTV